MQRLKPKQLFKKKLKKLCAKQNFFEVGNSNTLVFSAAHPELVGLGFLGKNVRLKSIRRDEPLLYGG